MLFTTHLPTRYLGYYVTPAGICTNTCLEYKKKQINGKFAQLRQYGVYYKGLPIKIIQILLNSHIVPLLDFNMQNIQYSSKQLDLLDQLLRKQIKYIIGARKAMPNLIFL
eukprot:NODE_550_length_6175_cov_0.398453.p8 type:complete len:110 gc:universal NODE_550_length_6175_cov_0.398453:2195-2524(+)